MSHTVCNIEALAHGNLYSCVPTAPWVLAAPGALHRLRETSASISGTSPSLCEGSGFQLSKVLNFTEDAHLKTISCATVDEGGCDSRQADRIMGMVGAVPGLSRGRGRRERHSAETSSGGDNESQHSFTVHETHSFEG
jgi:hypothetical protein